MLPSPPRVAYRALRVLSLLTASAFWSAVQAQGVPEDSSRVGAVAGAPLVSLSAVGATAYRSRGITFTNRPVLQTEQTLDFAGRLAGLQLGAFQNGHVGTYGDRALSLNGDGGPGPTELNFWIEYGRRVGPFQLTVGAAEYLFPNVAGGTPEGNTREVYVRADLPTPLPLVLTVYQDILAIHGTYYEVSTEHGWVVPGLGPMTLAVLAGGNTRDRVNYRRDGMTHVEVTATRAFALGPVELSGSVGLQYGADGGTRTVGIDQSRPWAGLGGLALSWSSR